MMLYSYEIYAQTGAFNPAIGTLLIGVVNAVGVTTAVFLLNSMRIN
jgi:hypothetical protein